MATTTKPTVTPLRKLRQSKGISQKWMADQLGIHPKTLQHYELGKHAAPVAVLFLAAHILQVPPENLTYDV